MRYSLQDDSLQDEWIQFTDPLSIGNATPPQLILSIRHGKRGKHKHWKGIPTHQLELYPFCHVEHPQASTLEGLSNLINDNGSYLQV